MTITLGRKYVNAFGIGVAVAFCLALEIGSLIRYSPHLTNTATSASSREPDAKANGNILGADEVSSLPRPRLIRLQTDRVIFLHVGKAAGQTLNQRLRNKWRIFIEQCHPNPCNDLLDDYKNNNKSKKDHENNNKNNHNNNQRDVLVTLRDPVDRFVSAFYWRSYMVGHPDPKQRVVPCPPRGCKAKQRKKEAQILFLQYHLNASQLAVELCSRDATVRQNAVQSLQNIEHARFSVEDWLGFDWKSRADSIFPLVVERGIESFENQTDRVVEWLHQRRHVEQPDAFARRRRYLHGLTNHTNNTNATSLSSSHSANAYKRDLTPFAEQCLIQYYRRDYDLLRQVRDLACKTEACRTGLDSILTRRAALLQQGEISS